MQYGAQIPVHWKGKSVESLGLGLIAAFLWGLHDFLVRRIGGRANPALLLLCTETFGVLLLAPAAGFSDGWAQLTPISVAMAVVSGFCYTVAAYSLYRAFTIGPVRLVAPICGAFPMLSVAFAMLRGQPAGPLVWLGVLAVVGGIAMVTRGEPGADNADKRRAILWSMLACVGFAISFGLLQWAAEAGAELSATLLSRAAAVLVVLGVVLAQRPPVAPLRPLLPVLALMGALDLGAVLGIALAGGLPHAEYAAVASSIFGIITILLAWRLLNEPVRAAQWGGVIIVFAGIVGLGLV